MIKTIEGYLKSKSWEFESNGKDIATAFTTDVKNGKEQSFPLYFMPVEDVYGISYLRLVIVPFVEQPESDFPEIFWKNILLINHDLNQMKFSIDSDGDLELVLDIPISMVDSSTLDKALSDLADTAGTYIEEINNL